MYDAKWRSSPAAFCTLDIRKGTGQYLKDRATEQKPWRENGIMAGWGRLAVKVRNPQNFYGGLALVGLAVIALIATAELAGIEDARFGAGTAPRMFAVLLAFAGGGIALAGLLVDGPRIERFALRGPGFVIAAILAFAMMVRPLGLLIATYVTFMIAIMGSNE